MSDIFNPIGRNLPGFTGPALVSGVVSDPPHSLLALAAGTILKGTVLGRGHDGLTTVATDKGTVKVATNAHLPTGSVVTLEVRNAGDRLQVLILSVDTASGKSTPSHEPTRGHAHATGPASTDSAKTGTASSSAARGADRPAPAQQAARPTGQPPIEIVGSSAKAIVVQSPAAASLLPTPDVEIEPFTPPSPPVSVPADAAQKAQLLAQARLLIETPSTPSTSSNANAGPNGPTFPQPAGLPSPGIPSPGAPSSNAPSGTSPAAGTPLTGTQQTGAALTGALLTGAAPETTPSLAAQAVPPSPQLPGTALQPEVAARITALFAAAAAEEAQPATTTSAPQQAAPGVALPATGTPPAAAGPLLTQILAANTPAQPSAAPINTPLKVLPAGTELTLHVIAVLPTKGGEIEIAPEAARLTGTVAPIIGKVLGYTRAGHAVIDTPSGVLMMQERTRLPVGAQVALVLEPQVPAVAAALPPITSPQQALLLFSRGWPTLDDLLAVLRGSAPAPSSNGPGTPPPPPGIPQTGPKLAAGLATAIAALRTGDIEKLLGPMLASRKFPIDKDDMVKRLKEEFTHLSDLAKDRPAVDWRALFLPVYDPRIGLTQINLYYRHNSGDDTEKGKKDQGTRFLVEVNFAALGAFQLDGLIRGKRFDLMIRSRQRLSRNQRQDIIGIYENALELGGCTGGLEFRTVEVFPVSPLDELRQSHDHLTA